MFVRAPLVALSLVSSFANGMPTLDNLLKLTRANVDSSPHKLSLADELHSRLDKRLLFDPMTTPVDVTGDHAFEAPGHKDQRGPCPGLNALSNHKYIPHDGVTSLAEVIPAINHVYGMGLDLAAILAIMGVVWAGDPISLNPSFSIGRNSSDVNNALDNLGGLLSQPLGLVGSHNFIESDSSLTRDDLYVTGNNYALNMTKFMKWYDMADENGTYTMDIMGKRASDRFHESIYENPDFYYGPFTGMLARNAGYLFVGRIFANHSSAHPDGVLTKDIIKSFFAISGEEGNFTYNEGSERIPDNWYKVPVDYGLVQLNVDTVEWILKYPALGSIGGNTGSINSFTGVELDNLTDGVLNVETLLKDNNLLCFVFQVVKMVSPTYLANIYKTLSGPLNMILDALSTSLLDLSCPEWKDMTYNGKPLWDSLGSQFPGANKSGSAL